MMSIVCSFREWLFWVPLTTSLVVSHEQATVCIAHKYKHLVNAGSYDLPEVSTPDLHDDMEEEANF